MRFPLREALIILPILFLSDAGCRKQEKSSDEGSAARQTLLRFKTVKCVDSDGIRAEAFRLLIPVDWTFDAGIRWVLDNPGMPATARCLVRNPNGSEAFEVFPNQPFFWTNNPMVLQTFPIGSEYFGNEVRPPLEPVEALKRIALPRFRKKAPGLRVVLEENLPDLAAAVGAAARQQPGVTAAANGARLRIEYQRGNIWIEEEIYGVVESYTFPMQTMTGTVNNIVWTLDYLFSFTAEKGTLESHSKTFQTIVTSFRVNPRWYATYSQVVESLIRQQIRRIRSVGELSRIISQTHSEISDQMLQSYYDRQKVYDNVATNFSQHIRGVDEYYNPVEERPVELPSGYRQAWTNSLGEYVLSESEDFNPNIGSNQTWHKMDKK